MNDLISEFFYEGIRRIIPGLVVIALYYHKEVVKVFDAHHDFFFVMLNACILLIAWLIGFVIEQIMAIVCAFTWKLGSKKGPKIQEHSESDEKCEYGWCKNSILWIREFLQFEKSKLTPDNDEHKREKRRQGYLFFAEKTMCRSLWPIFLIAYFSPPEPFSNFPNIRCDSLYGIVVFIVFLLSWFWAVINDRDLKIEGWKTS
jgi:hypothetical protein